MKIDYVATIAMFILYSYVFRHGKSIPIVYFDFEAAYDIDDNYLNNVRLFWIY